MNMLSRRSAFRSTQLFGALLWSAALLAASPILAQGHKLSGPLPRAPYGNVGAMQVSADGAWIVYVDGGRLHSTPVKGDRAPVLLSTPGIFVENFAISGDGSQVVYGDSALDVNVVPIKGGAAPVRLAENRGDLIEATPDGSRVVFTAMTTAGALGLFSSFLDERAEPVPLHSSLEGEVQDDLQISLDSSRVVYRIVDSIGHSRLYAASVEGNEPARELTPSSPLGRAMPGFRITADGHRVVFVHRAITSELYVTELDGGPAMKLNPTLVERSIIGEFQLSPDGAHVYYSAQLLGRSHLELYRVSIGGSASTRISPDLAQAAALRRFVLTPDGQRVVYLADQDTRGVDELYTVAAAGGPSRRLNGSLVTRGDVVEFHLSPNSAQVVYLADQEVDHQTVFYAASLTRATAPVRLGGGLEEDSNSTPAARFGLDATQFLLHRNVGGSPALLGVRVDGSMPARVLATRVNRYPDGGFHLVPGSPYVVCRSALAFVNQNELFRVALDQDEPALRLSAPLQPGRELGDLKDFRITSDADRVVYSTYITYGAFAGEEASTSAEVEAVTLHGERRVTSLFPAGAPGVEEPVGIFQHELSHDGRWVVIVSSNLYESGPQRLYSAPVDGHRAALPISDIEGEFYLYGFGANDTLVYTAVQGSPPWGVGLYSAPADASAAPIELSASLPANLGYYHEAGLDPTGQWVVFRIEPEEHRHELYSARIDGSSPPVLLGSSFIAFETPQFSPDGRLVVFVADEIGDGSWAVYSTPIDGSASPTRLSPDLPSFGAAYVPRNAISADGSRVLLHADQSVDGAFDLFSAPITGGPATRLNPALVAGRSTVKAKFSPDGTRVVYLADQDQDEVFELYSVPALGGASPMKLNQPLVAGGNVDRISTSDFLITPDGARVLYRADAVLDERYELWSTPITSAQPIRLNQTLLADRDVLPKFQLSPDGDRVLYQANPERSGAFELFVAPTDRIKGVKRVNGALPPGGTTLLPWSYEYLRTRFAFARNDRVLYLASEETAGTFELFESFLGRFRPQGEPAAER